MIDGEVVRQRRRMFEQQRWAELPHEDSEEFLDLDSDKD